MLSRFGIAQPTILLPKKGLDLSKWAVIACDQYTSQPEYWKRVEKNVGDAPSTLNLIYPEVYLDQGRDDEFIDKINNSIQKYQDAGVLEPFEGFILIDRKTANIKSRKGLIVALDLEHYDFSEGAQTLIRATESTIQSRLPPRIKIREKASVEVPHILVLIDDPEKKVIEPLFKDAEVAYDFELMENGGHITGYKLDGDASTLISQALEPLCDEKLFHQKYPRAPPGAKPVLFAMGDGNHSLATAKSCWETLKKSGADENHPARYALVELQNLHDDGNQFEPIHRLLFNVTISDLLASFENFSKEKGMKYAFAAGSLSASPPEGVHEIEFRSAEKSGIISVRQSPFVLPVGTLTDFLDQYLAKSTATIDYVHGTEVIDKECVKAGTCAFVLPSMAKSQLYETVVCNGVLPRKTFSMGHADDKRFYLEARRIV